MSILSPSSNLSKAPSDGDEQGDIAVVCGGQGSPLAEQLSDVLDRAQHHKGANGSTCRAFLHAAHSALKEEASAMSPQMWSRFPSADKLETLNALLTYISTAKEGHPALEGALLCLVQVASVLLGFEKGSKATITSGLCSGVLAAAAFAHSETPLQLASSGIEVVRLGFWIGAEAHSEAWRCTSAHLQAQSSQGVGAGSWSLACYGPGLSEAQLRETIDDFQSRVLGKPQVGPLYISTVVSTNRLTVSGPPPLLDLFQRHVEHLPRHRDDADTAKTAAARFECYRLPLQAPYHSERLLSDAADRVLARARERALTPQLLSAHRVRSLLLPFESGNTSQDLLEALTQGVLTHVNRWDKVVEHLASHELSEVFYVDSASRGLAGHLGTSQKPTSLLGSKSSEGSPDDESLHSHTFREEDERIAIVSVSCRFPDAADSPETFWTKVKDQSRSRREIPPHLFDWKAYQPLKGKSQRNTFSVPYGNFLDNPDKFDNQLFNMSPKESLQLDPQHRWVLMCCYEAMEDAGFVPEELASYLTTRVGCFIGASSDDYRENASSEIGAYFITGNIRAFIPGHVSYCWNLEGPSNSIDTACSSSLVAIEAACDALRNKQCDAALAGGVNIMTQPQMFMGYERAGLLSPTGESRPFEDDVDGVCRGDGIGIVMLKRLSTALAEGDNVLGVIRAVQSNFAASLDKATRLGQPSQAALETLYLDTLRRAMVGPHDVSLLAVHGAGRRDAEAAEVNAIAQVCGSPNRELPLYLANTQPTFGFSEAASGMASLILALTALKHRQVPGLPRHTERPLRMNSAFCDLGSRRVMVPLQATNLPSKGRLFAGISSTNLFGGNSFLVLESGFSAVSASTGKDPRPRHIVTISAKSAVAVAQTRTAFLARSGPRNANIADLSYTTTARRQHYSHRLVATGACWEEVAEQLAAAPVVSVGMERALVAVSVSHDGSCVHQGGVKHLCATNRGFHITFEEALEAWKACGASREESYVAAASIAMACCWTRWLPIDVLATDTASLACALAVGGALSIVSAAQFAALQRGPSSKAFKRFAALRILPLKTALLLYHTSGSPKYFPAGSVVESAELQHRLSSAAGSPVPEAAIRASVETHGASLAIPGSRCFLLQQSSEEKARDDERLGYVRLDEEVWQDITRCIARLYTEGVDPLWKAYHSDYAETVRLIKLPNYQFDLQSYWMPYRDRGLLDDDEGMQNGSNLTAADKQPGRVTPFALLGTETTSSAECTATFHFDVLQDPLLANAAQRHHQNRRPTLPTAVFLEQGCEAASHLLSTMPGTRTRRGVQISDLRVLEAFAPGADRSALNLEVVRSGEDTLACTWIVNGAALKVASCSVQMKLCENAVPHVLEAGIAKQIAHTRDTASTLPGSLLMRRLSKVATYHQPFLRIKKMHVGDTDAVAIIAGAEEGTTTPQQSGLVCELPTWEALLQAASVFNTLRSDGEPSPVRVIESILLLPQFFQGLKQMEVYLVARKGGTHNKEGRDGLTLDCYARSNGSLVGVLLGAAFSLPTAHIQSGPAATRVTETTKLPISMTEGRDTAAPAPAQSLTPSSSKGGSLPESRTTATPRRTVQGILDTMRNVLIQELGVTEADITPERNLADLGLDSLMSLQVLSAMQDKVPDLELPGSLFMDYTTLGKVADFLEEAVDDAYKPTGLGDGTGADCGTPSSTTEAAEDSSQKHIIRNFDGPRIIKPTLVSGRSHLGKRTPMYLLPDGSGSGAVYADVADLGRPVYAVTSPYLNHGGDSEWSVEEIASTYVACIASIHPPGEAMYLGGWSFGGVVAFEACRSLEQDSQLASSKVLGVLLLDAPNPRWPPLPNTILDWVYGPDGDPKLRTQAPPSFSASMKRHFEVTLAALARYRPTPMARGPCFILVKGLDGLGGRPETIAGWNAAVKWLAESRKGIGQYGWEKFLPDKSATTMIEVAANHFTICKRGPTADIAEALALHWKQ